MKKIYAKFCKAEEIICGTFFSLIVALTLFGATMRWLKMGMPWIDDIAKLLFSWTAFLGADIGMRYSRLVGVDILTSRLPAKLQKIFQLITFVLIILILGIFVHYGFNLAISNSGRFFQTLPISYSAVTISLPVTSILMIITALVKISKILKNFGNDEYNIRKDIPDTRASLEELDEEEVAMMQKTLAEGKGE